MPAKRLKTLYDLRRYLASLITKTESGEINLTMSGKLTYMISTLAKIITDTELERRIASLEEKQISGKK